MRALRSTASVENSVSTEAVQLTGGLGSNDRAENVGTYSFCSCLSYYIFLYCLSTLAL